MTEDFNDSGSKALEKMAPGLAKRAAEAAKRAGKKREQEAVMPQQMFLPGMDELMRAMPNSVARSSLFAPIAKGRRKIHNNTVLVSRSDVILEYSGEQLDEADADITFQLVYQARTAALGLPVTIKRAEFLRAIGRSTGKHDYEWFHRRMKALTAATLNIEAKNKFHIGKTDSFHILQGFRYDDVSENYTYTLDSRWKVLFDNREFALIDWKKRLQIGRGQDMAKALQRLVATSSDKVQRYPLGWLKAKMQYAGRMRDFKDSLENAMRELERHGLEIIAGGHIEMNTKGEEQATWIKLGASE